MTETDISQSYRTPAAPVPPHVPPHLVFDFDFFHDERLRGDVQKGYMSLHRDAPDIFWTPRNGGHWMATRFADVRIVGITPKVFSSVDQGIPPRPEGQVLRLPPQDMDAPEHMHHRMLLFKFLSPNDLRKQEPYVRRLAIELIDKLSGRNSCDFKEEIAVVLPVTVFMTMMQWDLSRLHEFVGWVHAIIGSDDPAVRYPAFLEMSGYLATVIQQRIAEPGDDPISRLLASEINGARVSPERVQEMASLLFAAGLDTVTNAMTFTMQYLATQPDIQQRLRAHPDQIEGAIEEFLRRFSFVATQRRVTQDTDLSGVKLKAGDRIMCSLAAASNDDRSVTSPEQVNLDRGKCPHVAFMSGPHTCIGAPLARTEMRVLFEEWLKRMPDVALAPGYQPVTRGGTVMSLERLDIIW